MRKVIYSMSVSLDGYIESREGSLDWCIIDEEFHTFANHLARKADTFLYGRKLYEIMVAFWPTAGHDPSAPAFIREYAEIWRDATKIVFSSTLGQVRAGCQLAKGDILTFMQELKAQPGKDLGLGGAELAETFLNLGLIDEFGVFIQPVILGGGKPFLPLRENPLPLRLLESHQFGSGVLYLRYELLKE